MARYLMRLTTDRSPAEAFAYLADFRTAAEWDPGVASVELVAGVVPGPDAEYEVEASGSMLRYITEVYDPPTTVRLRGRNRWVTSVDTITVAPDDGGGSVVTYEADLVLNGPLRIFDLALGLAFRPIGDRAAKGLEAALAGTRVA
jgi:carbon monoxide dehydrogenase subunit G